MDERPSSLGRPCSVPKELLSVDRTGGPPGNEGPDPYDAKREEEIEVQGGGLLDDVSSRDLDERDNLGVAEGVDRRSPV